jgi:hypothetical protein
MSTRQYRSMSVSSTRSDSDESSESPRKGGMSGGVLYGDYFAQISSSKLDASSPQGDSRGEKQVRRHSANAIVKVHFRTVLWLFRETIQAALAPTKYSHTF